MAHHQLLAGWLLTNRSKAAPHHNGTTLPSPSPPCPRQQRRRRRRGQALLPWTGHQVTPATRKRSTFHPATNFHFYSRLQVTLAQRPGWRGLREPKAWLNSVSPLPSGKSWETCASPTLRSRTRTCGTRRAQQLASRASALNVARHRLASRPSTTAAVPAAARRSSEGSGLESKLGLGLPILRQCD